MATKTELLKELADAEAATARLRKLIDETPDDTGNNKFVFKPAKCEEFYVLRQSGSTGLFQDITEYRNNSGTVRHGFRNSYVASIFTEALNVMLELRAQPGACHYDDKRNKIHCTWFVELSSPSSEVRAMYHPAEVNDAVFSGFFSSKEAAEKAIKTVGAERIANAMKLLAGY